MIPIGMTAGFAQARKHPADSDGAGMKLLVAKQSSSVGTLKGVAAIMFAFSLPEFP